MTEKLLREYIRETLLLEAGGDGAMTYNGGYGGYLQYGSTEDLTNAFLKPFTDVIKTTAGKAKEISLDIQSMIKVGLHVIWTSVNPAIETEFTRLFEERSDSIKSIRSQYKEVYDSNWDAIKSEDAIMFAFLYNPIPVVMGGAAKAVPAATLGILDTISGGWITRLKEKMGGKTPSAKKNKNESYLRENKGQISLDNKELVAKSLNTPKALHLINTVRDIVHENIEKTLELFYKYYEVKSLEEIEKNTGVVLDSSKITDEMRKDEAIVKQLLMSYKLGIKNQILTGVDSHISIVLDGGIPDSSEYISKYKNLRELISKED